MEIAGYVGLFIGLGIALPWMIIRGKKEGISALRSFSIWVFVSMLITALFKIIVS